LRNTLQKAVTISIEGRKTFGWNVSTRANKYILEPQKWIPQHLGSLSGSPWGL